LACIKHKSYEKEDAEKSPMKGGANAGTIEMDTMIKFSAREKVDFLKSLPPDELQIVDDFLEKFIFVSDGVSSKETIDLKLVLKSLPLKFD